MSASWNRRASPRLSESRATARGGRWAKSSIAAHDRRRRIRERESGRAQGDDVAVGGGGPVDGDGHRIASHGGGGIRDDRRGVERRIACRHLFQEDLR